MAIQKDHFREGIRESFLSHYRRTKVKTFLLYTILLVLYYSARIELFIELDNSK